MHMELSFWFICWFLNRWNYLQNLD